MNLLRVAEWNAIAKRPQLQNPGIIEDKAVIALRIKLLREEVDELEEAYEKNDVIGVLDALCDIQVVLNGGVAEAGMLDVFPDAMDEVCDSNDSKFILDGEGNKIPVLREGDNKIMKGHKYRPADLVKVLDRHQHMRESQPVAYEESRKAMYAVNALSDAWNLFLDIPQEPQFAAVNQGDFAFAINNAKRIIATMSAKRYLPYLLR